MRKTFNITEEDMDIVPHLETKVNQSRYIISLIRKDMEEHSLDIEQRVISIVDRYLNKKQVALAEPKDDFPMDTVFNIIGG